MLEVVTVTLDKPASEGVLLGPLLFDIRYDVDRVRPPRLGSDVGAACVALRAADKENRELLEERLFCASVEDVDSTAVPGSVIVAEDDCLVPLMAGRGRGVFSALSAIAASPKTKSSLRMESDVPE